MASVDSKVSTPATKPPVKAKKPASSKSSPEHPKYKEMIRAAIVALSDRGGSSRQAILKYISSHYTVNTNVNVVNANLKLALKSATEAGLLNQSKGSGATGSFKLAKKAAGDKEKPKASKPKATAKKDKVKSPAKPKPKKIATAEKEKKTTAKKKAPTAEKTEKKSVPKKKVKKEEGSAKKTPKKDSSSAKKQKSPAVEKTKKATKTKKPAVKK